MKACEVISENKIGDFTLRYCLFLDAFYRSDAKEDLICDEPTAFSSVPQQQYAQLAAAVHYLANKEKISVPGWVMKGKYFLSSPIFPFDTERKDYRAFMKSTTPHEFSIRNVLYGDNACKRV